MYVCICHSVTDRQIRQAAASGVATLDDLRRSLKVATNCGRCESCARDVLEQARREILDTPCPVHVAIPAFA
jgi:bacterioferritin-associated ferredoxin